MPTSSDKKPTSTKKPAYIHTVGRRKTSVARVRLHQKPGDIIVNNQPIKDYFPGKTAQTFYLEPFRTTNTLDKFSATIKVQGGGKVGQLGAVIHGLSRALDKLDRKAHHLTLKKKGFLTRDSRMKERRKVGTGGKARRRKQSPKR